MDFMLGALLAFAIYILLHFIYLQIYGYED
jgi:hypothetical protein